MTSFPNAGGRTDHLLEAEELKDQGFTGWLTRLITTRVFCVLFGSPRASPNVRLIITTSHCGWYYFSYLGTERLSDTLKVTQLLRGRAGIGTQVDSLLVFMCLPGPHSQRSLQGSCQHRTVGCPCPLPLHSLSRGQLQSVEMRFWNRMWVEFQFATFQLCDPGQAA